MDLMHKCKSERVGLCRATVPVVFSHVCCELAGGTVLHVGEEITTELPLLKFRMLREAEKVSLKSKSAMSESATVRIHKSVHILHTQCFKRLAFTLRDMLSRNHKYLYPIRWFASRGR